MSDREKAISIAIKYGAAKTASAIKSSCYDDIFAAAVSEIGVARVVDALREAREAKWAYSALRLIALLTERQRSVLVNLIADTDAECADCALRYLRNLSKHERVVLLTSNPIRKESSARPPKMAHIFAAPTVVR